MRHPGLFEALQARAEEAGVGEWFRYVGFIPYRDVLGLMGETQLLLQPSKFEGWSTPIEEAKSLGAPILLSDLPIHREQVPDGTFFQPDDAEGLAEALIACSARPAVIRELPTLRQAQSVRVEEYAQALAGAVARAAAAR